MNNHNRSAKLEFNNQAKTHVRSCSLQSQTTVNQQIFDKTEAKKDVIHQAETANEIKLQAKNSQIDLIRIEPVVAYGRIESLLNVTRTDFDLIKCSSALSMLMKRKPSKSNKDLINKHDLQAQANIIAWIPRSMNQRGLSDRICMQSLSS